MKKAVRFILRCSYWLFLNGTKDESPYGPPIPGLILIVLAILVGPIILIYMAIHIAFWKLWKWANEKGIES